MAKTLYDVLGVSQQAEDQDIKAAYRGLVKKYHPDLHPGDEQATVYFKEIVHAYDVLLNHQKRRRYDERVGPCCGQQSVKSFDTDALFAKLFAKNTQSVKAEQGLKSKVIRYTMTISFLESVRGVVRRLKLHHGEVVYVKVPAGIEEGQCLKLKTQMSMKHRGRIDDIVEIRILPHKYFERDQQDIFLDLPISLREAIIGGSIVVPTIHGQSTLEILPGTNTGTVLRLAEQGITMDKRVGDQYVVIKVMLPQKLDLALSHFIKSWSVHYDYDVRQKFF